MAPPPVTSSAGVSRDEVARELHALIDDFVAIEATPDDLAAIHRHVGAARRELAARPRSHYWERDDAGATYRSLSPYRGASNPAAPPMRIVTEGDGAELRVVGSVEVPAFYEGPPGCVHGGFLAGLFDELMGATQAHARSASGVTARLVIRYRAPTPIAAPLRLVSWVERSTTAFTLIAAHSHHGDVLTAQAEGLFMRSRPPVQTEGTND